MKKLIAFLFAGMLVAASANATTYYVSTTGSNDSLGTSSGTAWATIGKANITCANGDVVLVSAGTYHESIAPETGGVTFIGDSAACNKVIVDDATINVANTVVNGFRIVAEVGGTPPTESATGPHFRNCVLVRGATFYNHSRGRIEACRLGTDSLGSARFQVTCATGPDNWVLKNNTFKLRDDSLAYNANDYLFALHAVENWPSSDNTMAGNKIIITLKQAYTGKATMLRMMERLTSYDNKWTFYDSTNATSTGPQGYLLRDRVKSCSFLRDTIIQHTYFAGKGVLYAQLIGSGATIEGSDNVWKFCVFKSDIPNTGFAESSGGYAPFYLWQFQPRDSFYYNVVACSTGVQGPALRANNVLGPVVIYRNTIMNKGTGGALWIGNTGSSGCPWESGHLSVHTNIFYTGAQGSGSNAYAAFFALSGNVTTTINRNLYANYAGTAGSRDIKAGNCFFQTFYTPGTQASLWGAQARDVNSVHGTPRFTDSTFANFNAIPLGGAIASAAIGLGFGGETAGVYDTTGASSDGTRPDEISDLQVTGVSSNIVNLQWTATGDDSLTGTVVEYDIRYSTSEITSGNFSSATRVTAPIPSTTGSTERLPISGLASCTTYYFAIKAKDEANNWSAISNVATASTTSGSGLPCVGE